MKTGYESERLQRSVVQPGVTTNIIWIDIILIGSRLVGRLDRLVAIFFVNNRCREITVDSEQGHNDYK